MIEVKGPIDPHKQLAQFWEALCDNLAERMSASCDCRALLDLNDHEPTCISKDPLLAEHRKAKGAK